MNYPKIKNNEIVAKLGWVDGGVLCCINMYIHCSSVPSVGGGEEGRRPPEHLAHPCALCTAALCIATLPVQTHLTHLVKDRKLT